MRTGNGTAYYLGVLVITISACVFILRSWILNSSCKIDQADLQIVWPSYHLNSWTKSALIQNPCKYSKFDFSSSQININR